MNSLQTSVPTRLAATLAVAAGLLTGALWPSGPFNHGFASRAAQTDTFEASAQRNQIDPSIPVLTVVGRKLSAAEKRQLAQEERRPDDGGLVTVSSAAQQRSAADSAF